jgi:Tannase-like family of unknown function (DUF6351)
MRRPRALLILLAAGVVATIPSAASAHPAAAGAGGGLTISVLSGRADTLSGGDALVAVTGGRDVQVKLNGKDITAAFATRAGGQFAGLVTGLQNGANLLTAETGRLADKHAAAIVLTNHPNGGPVFAGAQVQPWDCLLRTAQTGLGAPTDAQCNTPAVTAFVYQSTAGGALRPYDPAAPPADVAMTTTDQGRTVPFIVRQETGVQDRSIYRVAVLADPAATVSPFTESAWNHKVVWPFGGGSAPHHTSDLPVSVLDPVSLGRGFLVASSGLNVHGSNSNDSLSAEAVTMLKEHVVETYGQIRYTIGSGCSGGSIQQQFIAEQYPGLLDGILPNCSYPDTWTTSSEVADCGLLVNYFAATPGWTDAQKAAVQGTADPSACVAWNLSFVPVGIPSRAQNCGFAANDPRVYNAATNPAGVRCVVPDFESAIWGTRPQALWSPAEQAAGHGFGARVTDNVGVLYGLNAVRSGAITMDQFVDLNTKIGGTDVDGNPQPARSAADPNTPQFAYRAGIVTQALRLSDVPMIDLRGTANINNIHTDFHSWEMRARLDAAHGSHANQVIWTWRGDPANGNITPAPDVAVKALTTMDAWLAAIEADHRSVSKAAKVVRDKPAAAVDSCYLANTPTNGGAVTVDPEYRGACGAAFPHFGDARTAAGDQASGEALKCDLTSLRRSSLPATTDAQWAALRAAFGSGVCDFRRPGVGFRLSQPWVSFASGPGGRPLGAAPESFRVS